MVPDCNILIPGCHILVPIRYLCVLLTDYDDIIVHCDMIFSQVECTSDMSKREGRARRVHVTPILKHCKRKQTKAFASHSWKLPMIWMNCNRPEM